MALTLYSHPLSSYCWKALTALYENGTPFTYRSLEDPEAGKELAALWPLMRFPVLVDAGETVFETSLIIEHLDLFHPGPTRFIPAAPRAALEVRRMDRVFDNYIQGPQGRIVFDAIRPEADRDARGVAEARQMLETTYAWLDGVMAHREWAAGDAFTLADCSAAPALFYADWTHKIPEAFPNLLSYRRRLLARPSFARAVDEGRPYRHMFPLGAPDRD